MSHRGGGGGGGTSAPMRQERQGQNPHDEGEATQAVTPDQSTASAPLGGSSPPRPGSPRRITSNGSGCGGGGGQRAGCISATTQDFPARGSIDPSVRPHWALQGKVT
jgi:hypothetical protein